MAGERLLHILALFGAHGGIRPSIAGLCEVGAEVVAVTGVGVMLMSSDLPWGSVCSSDELSATIEELQFTLGEGPCMDAYRQARPVLEPDLVGRGGARWLAFAPPAVAAGARAVFGFPVQVGAIRLGALSLCRDRPGPLSDDQHANALVMAGVAARAVLAVQAQAPAGALARELEAGSNFRFVVHQAAGMVAAQLEAGMVAAPGLSLLDTALPVDVAKRSPLASAWRCLDRTLNHCIDYQLTLGPMKT